jgi:predicted permease
MSHLVGDLRYSLRLLAGAPGFTAVAVLILALGIGANTAIFSVVNALVLQPRPGRVDSLVTLFSRDRTRPDDFRDFSYPLYADLRERDDIFESLLARTFGLVGIGDGESTRRSFVEIVSANYFSTLGVPLAAGRPFTPAEERPGTNAAVVIASHAAWAARQFDPAYIGSTVRVNGFEYTIVGVAPRGFAGTMSVVAPEWWFPLGSYDLVVNEMFRQRSTGLDDRGNHALSVTGALRSGLGREAAERLLEGAAAQLAAAHPQTDRDRAFELTGVPRLGVSTRPRPREEQQIVGVAALLSLMAALVLVVACVNLANLLLARGAARRREIAIRQALGAGRSRIIGQLFVEGLTLSLLGAAAGLVFAWWSTQALGAWLSAVLPLGIQLVVEPSLRLLPAAAGFAVLSTILFALGPAWRISHPAVVDDLKGTPTGGWRRFRTAAVLVGTQLAVSLALVAVGGLFMRGAVNAASANPGYSLEGQLVITLDPGLAGYNEAQTRTVYRDVLQRVRSSPGVEHATLASLVPFGEIRESRLATLPGGSQGVEADVTIITSNYFETLRLPILRGRAFSATEDEVVPGTPPVLINDRLARRLFGEEDPIDRPINVGRRPDSSDVFVVAGVVPATRHDLFDREPEPHLYLPYGSQYRASMNLLVAATPGTDAPAALGTILRELQQLDPRLPIVTARTMAAHRDASLPQWGVKAAAVLFSTFAALALLLATIGIYGLKAYEVARRTREIGIRMALGATGADVTRLVVREGFRTTVIGLAGGLLMAFGLGRLLTSLLYNVSPSDPATMVIATAVLAAATLLASFIPARRATRVAPVQALRTE